MVDYKQIITIEPGKRGGKTLYPGNENNRWRYSGLVGFGHDHTGYS